MDNHTPDYEPDDGPLTDAQIEAIRRRANIPDDTQWDPGLLDMSEDEYRAYLTKE